MVSLHPHNSLANEKSSPHFTHGETKGMYICNSIAVIDSKRAKPRFEAEALVGTVSHPAVLPGLRLSEELMSLLYQHVTVC